MFSLPPAHELQSRAQSMGAGVFAGGAGGPSCEPEVDFGNGDDTDEWEATGWGWPDFCHMLAQLFFCSFAQHHCNFRKTLAKVPDAVTVQPAGVHNIFTVKFLYFICTYSILLFVLYTVLRTAKAYYLQSVLSRYDCTKISSTVQGQYNGASVLNYFAKNLFGRCAAV